MDFIKRDSLLDDGERLLRDTINKFVDEEVTPLMEEAFEAGVYPKQLTERMAELGLFGMTLPAQYGGSDASYVMYGLACEALERGDSGVRSVMSVQSSLCMYPIFEYGSEEQRMRFLPKMAKGEWIGCFGLTEPDAGSDPASMRTTAKKVDGGWQLNGSKMWITNGGSADLAVVWAKTEEGIRGFIVEKGAKGFSQTVIHHKMSLRASETGALFFEDCFVPDENFLENSTRGLVCPLSCLTKARYGIAWGTMGAAQACYEIAVDYTKERKQFDKPVAANQLVQKDLATMLIEITKGQLLNLQVGRLKDKGEATHVMVSMAKLNGCRQALAIARSARNLLGANGISLEYHVIRHMNNLESVFTYEGTDNIHHLILGREITGLNAF